MDKSKLYELLGSYNDEMLELWENLVNVDSGPDAHEGVKKVSDTVAEFLRNIGFFTRTINLPNAGNMLVAEYGDMTQPFVVITGHMDTVFNKGAASARAFKIEDGKAYGPGVLDMKGGITIALFVLKALLAMNYQKHPIKIIFAGDEEIGHSCSTAPQEFVKEGTGAFAAFNMETGFPDNGLVVERKGMYQFMLEVFGRGAHVGNAPKNGRNAIKEIASKLLDIEALTDWDKGNTFNVGVIEGGTVCNSVAAYAKIICDLRFVDSSYLPDVKEALQKIVDKQYVEGTKTVLTSIVEFSAMKRLDTTMELFALVKRTAQEEGFSPVTAKAVGGASDSAYLTNIGIPTVCAMGVIGEHNHTVEEFAIVATMLERAKLLAAVLVNV